MGEENYFQTGTEVSLADMNLALSTYMDARKEYDEAKAKSSSCHSDMKLKEGKLLEMLEGSGLDKYSLPKIGTVSMVSNLQFNTPKTLDEKRALYGYISRVHGKEVLEAYLTINSRTLNSFLNEEFKSVAENGGDTREIPIKPPVESKTLRFTKARSK